MMSGALKRVIYQYKFDGVRGWAVILGRVLAGYLDDHEKDWFGDVDLVVASPTFRGPGARNDRDLTGDILRVAAEEALGDWAFDDPSHPAIIKTRETPPMKNKTWQQRRKVAETDLRDALLAREPATVAGGKILVFDDVFTDGTTLREVARALRGAGAVSVSQVSLARQPY